MSPDADGTVYRAQSRVALTTPGVAVIGTALPLLAGVVDGLVSDGLGWLFGVPLVLVSVYCAWEARPDARRAALVVPPLATLLTVLVVVLVTNGFGGSMKFGVNVFRVLAGQAAPWLVLAEVLVAAVVVVRHRRDKGVSPAARP
jgi:hypothetical protein